MTFECVQKWEMAPNLWSSETINHHKPWLEGTVFSKYLSMYQQTTFTVQDTSNAHENTRQYEVAVQSTRKAGSLCACFFFADWKLFTVTIRWVKIVRPWDTQRWHVSWHVAKPDHRVFHQDMADRSKQLRRSLRGISRHTWKYQRHRSMVEDNCRAIA